MESLSLYLRENSIKDEMWGTHIFSILATLKIKFKSFCWRSWEAEGCISSWKLWILDQEIETSEKEIQHTIWEVEVCNNFYGK